MLKKRRWRCGRGEWPQARNFASLVFIRPNNVLCANKFAPTRTAANDRNERPVWQRRFWEHALRNEEDWRNHMDYIHYNPVKHGLANRPGDWPWSSFGSAVAKGWYEASWGAGEPATIAGMDCE